MKISKIQEERILELDISGWGGYDEELAASLGMIRESARFHDAVSINGKRFEFKKQASQQWIDLYKLSQLSNADKLITILFFIHKEGKIVEIYKTNYKKLIKSMGMKVWDLQAINKLYQREAMSKAIQMKAPLNFSKISSFKLIWKRK